jgi:hypothetical protein
MLAACMLIEDVALRNPEDGTVVVCPGLGGVNVLAYEVQKARQRDCIARLEQQGYTRVPRP